MSAFSCTVVNMSLLQLFLLLMLAQSGFGFMRQNVSYKNCSDKVSEIFSKQQNAEGGYHLTVKEKLSSVAFSKNNHPADEDQMVDYQSKQKQ